LFFIILTIALGTIYGVQDLYRPYIPLPDFLEIFESSRMVIAVLYLFCWPLLLVYLRLSKWRVIFKISLVLAATLTCCLAGYKILQAEHHLNMASFGEYRYHLVFLLNGEPSITTFKIYKCNYRDLECGAVGKIESYNPYRSNLVVDSQAEEIHVLFERTIHTEYDLVYTYGSQQSRVYKSWKELGDAVYALGIRREYDTYYAPYTYLLFRCTKDYTSCKRLPFEYIEIEPGFLLLNVDQLSQELQIVRYFQDKETLIYAYGSQPRCFVKECSLREK
jgi:hypothetical protein